MHNLKPPSNGADGLKPPLIVASDLWECYRIRKNITNAAAGGHLPIAFEPPRPGRDRTNPRAFNKLAALWWAVSRLKRQSNSKVNFLALDRDYKEMLERGYTLDGETPPPQEPEGADAAGDDGDKKKSDLNPPSAGEFYLDEQLKALREVDIPDDLRQSARSISEIGKAISDMASANERQMRLLIDAGRMVHVDEIEVLIRSCLEDWIDELRDLHLSIDSKIAGETGLPIKTCRQVLRLTADYLLDFGKQSLERVERETLEYTRSKQRRRRGSA